jgi:hypothetical protein
VQRSADVARGQLLEQLVDGVELFPRLHLHASPAAAVS